jgi:hypothetical protein
MPKYIVSSEGPIHVRQVGGHDPVDPDYGIDLPEYPSTGLPGGRPGHPIYPVLPAIPPRDEWPPLPPGLQPGPGFPIPPSPEFPMVPVEPSEPGSPSQLPELPPGMVWPPVRPELPEMGNKFIALAFIYTSKTGGNFRWIVIDKDALPKPPAGGIGGTPPTRPTPTPR